jgi:hypothetical protein
MRADAMDYTARCYWPLIVTLCSPEGAVGPRALLLHSSQLEVLWGGTLQGMVRQLEGFRVAGFDKVCAQCSVLI